MSDDCEQIIRHFAKSSEMSDGPMFYAKCTIRWPLSVSLMVKIFFHSWEYLLLLSNNHMSQPHTDEILELKFVWFLFYDSFS